MTTRSRRRPPSWLHFRHHGPSRLARVAIAALAGVTAIAALVAWALSRPALVAPVLPSRFAIVPPPAQPLNVSGGDRDLALSPDGQARRLSRRRNDDDWQPIACAVFDDQVDARPLADISPRIRAVLFARRPVGRLLRERARSRRCLITGGPVITLGPVTGRPLGASWGDDNTIVFATDDRAPVSGACRRTAASRVVLTTPDAAQGESDHQFPGCCRIGRGVLFTIAGPGNADKAHVAVLDLKTVTWKTLVTGGQRGRVRRRLVRRRTGWVSALRDGRHAARRAVRSGPTWRCGAIR